MTAVMISIRPEWCKKIFNGEKTLELRKSKPKLNVPFKCYVYCTKPNTTDPHQFLSVRSGNGKTENCNGKIIGEFTCDYVQGTVDPAGGLVDVIDEKCSCLSAKQIIEYAAGDIVYFWHISNPKLYDEPKRIADFKRGDACPYLTKEGCSYKFHCFRAGQLKRCGDYLDKPPQSWCYVDEVET